MHTPPDKHQHQKLDQAHPLLLMMASWQGDAVHAWQAYYVAMLAAQAPPIMFNTVVGALVAYGLGNLNPSAAAVALSCLMMALVALCAIQLLTMCTLWAPNQDLVSTSACAVVRLLLV